MKIVVSPDKFKGTLSAQDASKAIEAGVKRALTNAEVIIAPVADGGEGTVDAMLAAAGGSRHKAVVTGPLGDSTKAEFGVLPDGTAIVEMAQASGLWLVPADKRDPTVTTTYGTGELIEAVLDLGAERLIIGIGGSATCDGGIGAAQALGVKFLKKDGSAIGFGGRELIKIAKIDTSDTDPRVKRTRFLIASDVKSPLYGPKGAAHVFAPQKGATEEQVILLDQGLINLSKVIKKELGVDVSELPGAGAAGGLGAGLVAFLGATIKSGVDLIIKAIGLEEKIKGADLLITGEGQIDFQSAFGKAPIGVARLAKKHSIKTVAIAGRLGERYEKVLEEGVDVLFSLEDLAGSTDEAMKNPFFYLENAAYQALKELL